MIRYLIMVTKSLNYPIVTKLFYILCQQNHRIKRCLQKKLTELRDVSKMLLIDTLSNDETNLDLSTSHVQFREESTQFSSFQRDSDKNDGGLKVFVNKILIVERFYDLENEFFEKVC